MTNSEGCVATLLGCIIAAVVCFLFTFGIAFAIAYLIVSMGLLSVSVLKLTLLICLIKLAFFNYHVNFTNSRKRKNNE